MWTTVRRYEGVTSPDEVAKRVSNGTKQLRWLAQRTWAALVPSREAVAQIPLVFRH